MTNSTMVSNSDWYENLANDILRDKVLSRDSVVVYSQNLESVLWANVSGAKLFGGDTIDHFLNDQVEQEHPFIRQLNSAVKQLGNEKLIRGFRVVDQGKSKLLLCEIGTIDLEENGSAILISCANSQMDDLREHEFLQEVLENLPALGAQSAICDEYGLLMAASDEFVELDILPEELEKACALKSADHKNLEVETGTGGRANLLRIPLDKNPSRILVLASELEANDLDSVDSEPTLPEEIPPAQDGDDDDESDSKGFVGGVVAGMAAASTVLFGQRKGEAQESDQEAMGNQNAQHTNQENNEEEENSLGNEDELEETLIETQNVEEELQDTTDEVLAGDQTSGGDSNDQGANDQGASDQASENDDGHGEDNKDDQPDAEFVFSAEGEPVRFAWTTDTDLVFTSLSDELAAVVGPNAADLIGRKWGDVARVFGFDTNGEIRSLLQNQDTWSGKSVLWPIQGTDLQVPIDLAALPSFSRGRSFDGFRGFGIVRQMDTIVDPEETGMALVSGGFSHVDDTNSDEGQYGQETTVGEDDRQGNEVTNVVDLKSRRNQTESESGEENRELTNGEHKAFDEIGQKLRDPSMFAVSRLHEAENKKGAGSEAEQSNKIKLGKEADESRAIPTQDVDTSLLEKLPVPVIVYRGSEVLFANHELFSLLGFTDIEELQHAGGIEVLFDNDDDIGFADDIRDENYTILNDIDGGKMRVKALLKSVPWDGERALLMSFRQPKHEKLPADEKLVLDMMQVSELQNILDTATDGIVILAKNGDIHSMNPSAEALFGKSDDDCRGKHVEELFATESHKSIQEYLSDFDNPALRAKLNDGREVLGVEAKGGLIPLYVTIGKVGNSDKFCLVLRDMTPWKKTQEELVFARKQAEDASEQKTEFLARVSHEIRTPLNAIIGFSDVMIEERFGAIDVERYREYLRDINRSGIHVLDLVNDLLDISKIEAGKMELSFEAVDLNKIVAETVALLQPQANGNRVLIRTSLSRAVPDVVADARSIRQIVLNLVSNAIKFTDASGQVIISTVYEGNGEVALRVRDTGRGMNKEEIVVALKPFKQINALNEPRGQGTGLGLPLTKALVEANKAYLDIESEPGEGTIVHIQFPTQRVLAD